MKRRLALAAVLAMVPGAASGAVPVYLGVDVPARLAGTDYLPSDLVRCDGAAYALGPSVAPGAFIGGIHMEPSGSLLVSFRDAVTISPLDLEGRDVARIGGSGGALVFDGSASGVPAGAAIDAIMLLDDGRLVLSFDATVLLGGLDYPPADLISWLGGSNYGLYWSGAAAGIPNGVNLVGASLTAAGSLVLSFDEPFSHGTPPTTFLPGDRILAIGTSLVLYERDAAWPAYARLADFSFPASPGAVPDGNAVPGVPLTAVEAGGTVTLSWGASCRTSATDYSVHEGALGSFYGHTTVQCSTSGALGATVTAAAGDRYFLVVPSTTDVEGSYGMSSAGVERPASTSVCKPQWLGACP